MRVLITGGSGFLGINLVRGLLARGVTDITVLDIAPFDYPDVRDRVSFVKGDIRDRDAIMRSMPGRGAVIVHAAAALPLYSREDIFSTEVDGVKLLLEEAVKSGAERFIHISTTAVYGIPDHHPLEETAPLAGVGPYGRGQDHGGEPLPRLSRTGPLRTDPAAQDVRGHRTPGGLRPPVRMGEGGQEFPRNRQRPEPLSAPRRGGPLRGDLALHDKG